MKVIKQLIVQGVMARPEYQFNNSTPSLKIRIYLYFFSVCLSSLLPEFSACFSCFDLLVDTKQQKENKNKNKDDSMDQEHNQDFSQEGCECFPSNSDMPPPPARFGTISSLTSESIDQDSEKGDK